MIGRIPVLDVQPLVDCGRHPVKAVPGETFHVSATILREGDEALGANVVLRDASGRCGPWTPMRELAPGGDRWGAAVTPDSEGRWTYAIEAWGDPVATWRRRAEERVPAGVDAEELLEEGALLHERAAAGVPRSAGREVLLAAADAMRSRGRGVAARLAAALTPQVTAVLARHPLRELVTATRPLPLQVARERALFGSWYELFPRSEGALLPDGPEEEAPVPGTLRTAADRLPALSALGFDVVCLPPVHPVGVTGRRGPRGAPSAGPYDVGSPWAVGSADGGHEAVDPALGTVADFEHFTARARESGLETALDFALQCSPDHPWIKEFPEWFRWRPDGTPARGTKGAKGAKHAEDSEDIVPLHFDNGPEAYGALVRETVRLLRLWMRRGVRIFRVHDAHTHPAAFWEKVLGEINRSDPEVLFLAGGFARPALRHTLAKAGFHLSSTPFLRIDDAPRLAALAAESAGPAAAFLRPHFAVNTPHVLPVCLQRGGRPAFATRAVLAATLAPSWGVYAGYELCEGEPLRPGREEYRDAETYELRPRDWTAAEKSGRTITPLLALLNRLRRRHPALRGLRSLVLHETDNDRVVAFSKHWEQPGAPPEERTDRTSPGTGAGADPDPGLRSDAVLTVVSLDPSRPQEATVTLSEDDLRRLSPAGRDCLVRDGLTGRTHELSVRTRVRLAADDRFPAAAHVFTPCSDDERSGQSRSDHPEEVHP